MTPATAIGCTICGREIQDCAFCEEPDCRNQICRNCLELALLERIPQLRDEGA